MSKQTHALNRHPLAQPQCPTTPDKQRMHPADQHHHSSLGYHIYQPTNRLTKQRSAIPATWKTATRIVRSHAPRPLNPVALCIVRSHDFTRSSVAAQVVVVMRSVTARCPIHEPLDARTPAACKEPAGMPRQGHGQGPPVALSVSTMMRPLETKYAGQATSSRGQCPFCMSPPLDISRVIVAVRIQHAAS